MMAPEFLFARYLAPAMVAAVALLAAGCLRADDASQSPLSLWFLNPAANAMNEALPIGAGRLGGLVFGGVERERIAFNESSLWTGDANPSGDYASMGAYQAFGSLFLSFDDSLSADPNRAAAITGYRRNLDLRSAIARTVFERGGIRYERDAFASNPAGVIVVRWTASKPGAISARIELAGAHAETTASSGDTLVFSGALPNTERYEADARIVVDGGTLKVSDGVAHVAGADDVVVLLAAGSDYIMDPSRNFRGIDPHDRLIAQIDAAAKKSYAALEAEHVADFARLFDRCDLWLGASRAEQTALPTDRRKAAAFTTADPELERILFQYGRYLMISSSRPGGLPANLQGLWNDSNAPAWHSDYHTNINIEMNYWPVETTNLSECFEPFYQLVDSQLPFWRAATAAAPEFNVNGAPASRGFAIRTSHNTRGGMGWNWDKTANAWYAQLYWEHYAFTQDKEYLRTVAYPYIKETVQFWQDHLKALPDGTLTVPNGWSPEHGPHEDGVAYNQEIVWDLLTNYLDASSALGVDSAYRAQAAALRDRLAGPRIGKWGQLQEWMEDRDDPNDHHRHTSHLFAVYPGRQIDPTTSPALAAAAKVSLDARGIAPDSDVREWSFAWRASLYARLHDGEDAHRMLQQLFANRNTCPNMFGLHPPMQIDGNFGITAAIAEMLLQSQTGEIELLPALPSAWPTGSARGLRARGGYVVDIDWKNGKLVDAAVRNVAGSRASCRLRYGSDAVARTLAPGERIVWSPGDPAR